MEKTISRILGIKVLVVESSAATVALVLHPDSAAVSDGSPQNPPNRGESGPQTSPVPYVLIAATTPCWTAAAEERRQKALSLPE